MECRKEVLIGTHLAYALVFILVLSVLSMPVSANGAPVNGENGPSMNDFISDERAKAIALEQTGGGQITLCRLSYNQNLAEYAVGVSSGSANYLFTVNAYTGEVESFSRKLQLEASVEPSILNSILETPAIAMIPPPIHNSKANFVQPNYQNFIDNDRARQIALARVGGGEVVRTERKSRYHKAIIVSGGNRYDVKINFDGSVRALKMKQVTTVGSKVFHHNTAGVIDAARAKSIALERAGGGIITACKLDSKSREGLVYKVKVVNGRLEHKIELFATTGFIYKHKSKHKSKRA